jgi:hypothetical protein
MARRSAELGTEADRRSVLIQGYAFLFAIDSLVGLEDGYVWSKEDVERLRRGGWSDSGAGACATGDSGSDAGGSRAGATCGCGASCGGDG